MSTDDAEELPPLELEKVPSEDPEEAFRRYVDVLKTLLVFRGILKEFEEEE